MLTDRAKIFVQGGRGGDGALSFRREAHVPKGGPDGGDGGRGADVVLVCDDSQRDLAAFRRRSHFRGARGGHGEGGERHGASPAAVEVAVPPGTAVRSVEGDLSLDLTRPGQRVVVARGGAGGRGNKRFAGPTRQTPRLAERGLAGDEGWLELQLKLIADVGLVGLPNAGKSSLLARLTRARPKVADYPFTTLEPALGVLDAGERQIVVADIPGLIEGASGGAGLGHEFLAHVERTRLLVHVLDLAPTDGSDPAENLAAVAAELAEHGGGLATLPRILCLSKADLLPDDDVEAALAAWRERDDTGTLAVVATSAATGHGLDDLKRAILAGLPPAPEPEEVAPDELDEPVAEHRVYRPAEGEQIRVEQAGPGRFRVEGRAVERLVARHDLENEDALRHIEDRLRTMGVIARLEASGFMPGDEVELGGVVFELDPGAPFK